MVLTDSIAMARALSSLYFFIAVVVIQNLFLADDGAS